MEILYSKTSEMKKIIIKFHRFALEESMNLKID